MMQIGVIEHGHSFTEISVADGFPDAYALSEDSQTLSLVILAGRLGHGRLPEIDFSEIKECITSLFNTISEILRGSTPSSANGQEGAGEFVYLCQQAQQQIKKIEVKIIAVGSTKGTAPDLAKNLIKQIALDAERRLPFQIELFDVPTLQEEWDKSEKSGTIDLDLREFLGHPLQCLKAPSDSDGFKTFLAIIPGSALAAIYERYKTRILQKNLRNFLQAKGKINKGMQTTLSNQPERFLAYNNGLTITASEAILNDSNQIEMLKDFQIVNGGQTTASLHHFKSFANIRDIERLELLEKVSVQAKITVVDTLIDTTFINDVSNYANSQNAVKLSDFGAKDKFHDALAKLMRNNEELACEWDNGETNYWYYESFRGGYLTAKNQLVGSKRKIFESTYPKDQVINKIDLARCENGWDGFPHFVNEGAEKNYARWNRRTIPQSRPAPDYRFCQELVAKVILYNQFELLVKKEGFAAFKSAISALSFSYFRYLLEIRNYEVDLNNIWELNHVPSELEDSMLLVIRFTEKLLRQGAAKEDPAQWAKKPVAWERFKETTNTTNYPKILNQLKSSGTLRALTFDLQVTCSRAIDEIAKSKWGLGKVEILNKLGIDNSHWDEIRGCLLRDYEVTQLGVGAGTTYRLLA